jgi:Rha family phage regulatory protein
MNTELVLVRDGQTVTTSRLVAEKFGKQHAHVLRAIQNLECPADFNASNFGLVEYVDSKGEARPEYVITKDGFAFLVMGFTGKKAAAFKVEFINAFNEAQRQLQSQKPAVPQTYLEALRELVAATEERERLAAAVEVLQPKADFYERAMSSENLMSVREMAKVLAFRGMGQNHLFDFLRSRGVLMRNDWNQPYQRFIDEGWCKVIETTWTHPKEGVQVGRKTVFTQRGVDGVRRMLEKAGFVPMPRSAPPVVNLPQAAAMR